MLSPLLEGITVSLFDSIAANTAGFLWRASTGTVDLWTLRLINEEHAATVTKAIGPEAAKREIAETARLLDSDLYRQGKHPAQALPRFGLFSDALEAIGGGDALKGLNRAVNGALLAGLIVVGVKVWPAVRRAYKGK